MDNEYTSRNAPEEASEKNAALRRSIAIVAVLAAAAALLRFLPGLLGVGGSAPWSKNFDGPVRGTEIRCLSCDVTVLPSEDGRCYAEYSGSRSCTCTAEVKNGTLTIEEKRPLPRFFAFSGNRQTTLKVYLPEETGTLNLSAVSGDLRIPEGFDTDKAVLETVSGDIFAGELRCATLAVVTVSGDVEISGTTVERNADFEAVSGELSLDGFTAGDITVETISGDVDAGDIDADTLDISTVSGNVSLGLRSPMDYDTSTVSGDVTVPASDRSGGSCRVSTTSGDIWIGSGAGV